MIVARIRVNVTRRRFATARVSAMSAVGIEGRRRTSRHLRGCGRLPGQRRRPPQGTGDGPPAATTARDRLGGRKMWGQYQDSGVDLR